MTLTRRKAIGLLSAGSFAAALGVGATSSALATTKFNFTAEKPGGRTGTRAAADKITPRRYRGKKIVDDPTGEAVGTIVISTKKRRLYFVLAGGKAIEYGIGVGRAGFVWKGTARVARKAEWPAWHPPKEMIEREKKQYGRTLPARMEGGINNPLGARALYLFQGNKDTLYRIHGTNAPNSIGRALSSGCIRMLNEEVEDLYQRVTINAKVIVA